MKRRGETTLLYLLEPIQDLLCSASITEIVVNKVGEVGWEIGGKWHWRAIPEFDFERLDAIGILAGSILSKPFDPAHPIAMTTLPGGQRCTLIRPPVTLPGNV
jgi:type IV secretion system protein VirB11